MGSKDKNEDLVTLGEAAEIIGVSKATVSYWLRTGKLKGSRPGKLRKQMVYVEDLLELREVKEMLSDPRKVGRMAVEALARIKEVERRIEALYTALGIDTPPLSLEQDDIISLYFTLEDICEGWQPHLDTEKVLEWAKIFLSVHREYLKLVSEITSDPEPIRKFLLACDKIIVLAQQWSSAKYDPVFRMSLQFLGFARRALHRVAVFEGTKFESRTKTMQTVEDQLMPLLHLR